MGARRPHRGLAGSLASRRFRRGGEKKGEKGEGGGEGEREDEDGGGVGEVGEVGEDSRKNPGRRKVARAGTSRSYAGPRISVLLQRVRC